MFDTYDLAIFGFLTYAVGYFVGWYDRDAHDMFDLDSLMGFGKYADKTVEEVLEDDPTYLKWCLENVPRFVVDDALLDAIESACRRRRA